MDFRLKHHNSFKRWLICKRLSILSLLLCFNINSYGQQDALYSQYMFNGLVLNPAYAGSHEVLTVAAIYRSQWVSIEGSPKTQTLTAHSPVISKKIGLGLMVFHDQMGINDIYGVSAIYSYQIDLRRNNKLSFGLEGGLTNYKVDWSKIKTTNPGDVAFEQTNSSALVPNFGTGLYFYKAHKYFIGVSVPKLLTNKIDFSRGKVSTSNVRSQYRTYFITAGYLHDINEYVKIQPSLLLKYVQGLPNQFDGNLQFGFYDMLKIGSSYRSSGALIFMGEYRLNKQLSLAYAYDLITKKLSADLGSSHEIMLRYEFSFEKDKVFNPRFL